VKARPSSAWALALKIRALPCFSQLNFTVMQTLSKHVALEACEGARAHRFGPVPDLPAKGLRQEPAVVDVVCRSTLQVTYELGQRDRSVETRDDVNVVGGDARGDRRAPQRVRLSTKKFGERNVERDRQDGAPPRRRPNEMYEQSNGRSPHLSLSSDSKCRLLKRDPSLTKTLGEGSLKNTDDPGSSSLTSPAHRADLALG
jgi:hypothetical protein